jgi:hypothetical protein
MQLLVNYVLDFVSGRRLRIVRFLLRIVRFIFPFTTRHLVSQ